MYSNSLLQPIGEGGLSCRKNSISQMTNTGCSVLPWYGNGKYAGEENGQQVAVMGHIGRKIHAIQYSNVPGKFPYYYIKMG